MKKIISITIALLFGAASLNATIPIPGDAIAVGQLNLHNLQNKADISGTQIQALLKDGIEEASETLALFVSECVDFQGVVYCSALENDGDFALALSIPLKDNNSIHSVILSIIQEYGMEYYKKYPECEVYKCDDVVFAHNGSYVVVVLADGGFDTGRFLRSRICRWFSEDSMGNMLSRPGFLDFLAYEDDLSFWIPSDAGIEAASMDLVEDSLDDLLDLTGLYGKEHEKYLDYLYDAFFDVLSSTGYTIASLNFEDGIIVFRAGGESEPVLPSFLKDVDGCNYKYFPFFTTMALNTNICTLREYVQQVPEEMGDVIVELIDAVLDDTGLSVSDVADIGGPVTIGYSGIFGKDFVAVFGCDPSTYENIKWNIEYDGDCVCTYEDSVAVVMTSNLYSLNDSSFVFGDFEEGVIGSIIENGGVAVLTSALFEELDLDEDFNWNLISDAFPFAAFAINQDMTSIIAAVYPDDDSVNSLQYVINWLESLLSDDTDESGEEATEEVVDFEIVDEPEEVVVEIL